MQRSRELRAWILPDDSRDSLRDPTTTSSRHLGVENKISPAHGISSPWKLGLFSSKTSYRKVSAAPNESSPRTRERFRPRLSFLFKDWRRRRQRGHRDSLLPVASSSRRLVLGIEIHAPYKEYYTLRWSFMEVCASVRTVKEMESGNLIWKKKLYREENTEFITGYCNPYGYTVNPFWIKV